MMVLKEALIEAKSLVEGGWTQQFNAVSENGDPISYISSDATKFCAIGAIGRVTHELRDHDNTWLKAVRLLEKMAGNWKTLSTWNDNPGRTQQDVLELFDDAINFLVAQED